MGKINSIQYLRAAAVILVIVFHCSIRTKASFSEATLDFLTVGSAGVDLFFVISGFIMWTIGSVRPTSPGEFIVRRLTRIVPIYWVMTALWVAIAAVGIVSWVKLDPDHVIQSFLFIPHYSPNYSEDIFPVLVPGWTLIYEMFFYAVFAVCLFVPGPARLAALCIALVGLVIWGWLFPPSGVVMSTYTNPILLEFLAGVIIGYLWRRGSLPTGWAAGVILIAGIAGLAFSTLASPDPEAVRVLYWGVPAALVVVGALGVSALQQPFPLLLGIGNASYSIYLSHTILLTFLVEAWRRVPMLPQTFVGGVFFVAMGVVASCIAGYLAYRFLEQPLEAFFRSLALSRGRQTSSRPS